MTNLPHPTASKPIVVGPYAPTGRNVWLIRHDGTLTHPEAVIHNRADFESFVERCRPAAVSGPREEEIHWVDRPDEWPA